METKQNLFMASISHELRTPLTSILGYGELLENTELDSKQKAYLSRMLHSSKYLLSLVGDFLDIVKLENNDISLDIKEVRCHTILTECADVIKANLHKDVKLETNIPFLSYNILADDRRIKQVMLNFLSNAVKFTKSGTIKFYVKEVMDLDNNKVKITVNIEDSGIGMSKEVQDALFHPFVTGDSTQGFGLGLHISKEIINLMDGDVKVSSQEGVGSQFSVSFIVEKGTDKKYSKVLNNRNILVLSDNEIYTRRFADKLSKFNAKLTYYSSSQDVASTLRNILSNEVEYDIAIFDLSSMFCSIADIVSTLKVVNKNIETISLVEEGSSVNLPIFDKVLHLPLNSDCLIYELEEALADVYIKSSNLLNYSNLKVLIVEDVEMSRNFIKEMFKVNFSLACDTAINGKEAVEKVESNFYDIVFMDVRMPIMNGHDASIEIRKFNKDLPIICMSADVYEKDKEIASKSGMNSFIEKPLNIEEVKKCFVEFLNIDVNIEDNIRTTRNIVEEIEEDSLKKVAFEYLSKHFGNEISTELLTTASQSINQYTTSISAEETLVKQLEDDCHAIKGVLANLGLAEVAKEAGELQDAYANNNIDNISMKKDKFINKMNTFLLEF